MTFNRACAWAAVVALAFSQPVALAAQSLNLTATYPIPNGVYNTITTVGDAGSTGLADTILNRNAGNTILVPPTNAAGRVGIGTASPSASYKLDINGEINAASYYRGGVLMGQYWTLSGNNIYNSNAGNVGVGHIYPGGGPVSSPQALVSVGANNSGHYIYMYSPKAMYVSGRGFETYYTYYPYTVHRGHGVFIESPDVAVWARSTGGGTGVSAGGVTQSLGPPLTKFAYGTTLQAHSIGAYVAHELDAVVPYGIAGVGLYGEAVGGWGIFCKAGDLSYCGGTSDWLPPSDARLKKDIRTIDAALDRVLKMRAVTFEWKDESRGRVENLGFIAQEMRQVAPEVVHKAGDGYYYMEQDSLTAVLTQAAQEQQERINALKKRVAALKAKRRWSLWR